MVDVLKVSGIPAPPAFGPVRLAGGMGPSPAAARWIMAGPERGASLAQEADPERAEIESAVRDLAVELDSRAGRLEGEFSIAPNDALRPGIPFIGKDFRARETMAAIAFAARALEDLAKSVLTGALAAYLLPEARKVLEGAARKLFYVWSNAEPQSESVSEDRASMVEEYLHSYVDDLNEFRDAAERLMVSAENGEIPVKERGEMERQGAEGVLLAIGALAAGGLLVWLAAS